MKIQKKSIAVILLFSFLGVQLISVGCTVINFCHQFSHGLASEISHHDHGHHHKHDTDHHSSSNENNEDESCCVENATVFLQGLEAVPQEINFVLNNTTLLAVVSLDQTLPVVLPKNLLFIEIRPPPEVATGGFLIRIIFQSFQL